MLTSTLVRVKIAKNRLLPRYVDPHDPATLEIAEQLLEVFRHLRGETRGELEADLRDTVGDSPGQLVHQGLAKLLEDRCEFEVVSGHPPDELRELVFRAAAESRRTNPAGFDRAAILGTVAGALGMAPPAIESGL